MGSLPPIVRLACLKSMVAIVLKRFCGAPGVDLAVLTYHENSPVTTTLLLLLANMFMQQRFRMNIAQTIHSELNRHTFCFLALQPLQAPLILVGICFVRPGFDLV